MLGFGFDLIGFPAATRYMRSPSAFSDVSVKPSFLRTTPAKNPRTECCCHPVAFMMAAIVVPLGCLSSPTKDKDFGLQRGPRPKQSDDRAPDQPAEIAHRGEYQPIRRRPSAVLGLR